MLTLFELPYIGLCIASLICVVLSIPFFRYNRIGLGLATLFVAAFLIRLFMAYQDAFLHPWDEQVHALVARNVMDYPLKPMLRNHPVAGYDPFCWGNCYVWLHKQPLFLWLGALSMKLFGVSEYVLRYPSVLLGALMVPLLYSITYKLTAQKWVGWLAAVLFCFSNFQLEFISGVKGMDHNDVAFGFFVLAGIWAVLRYFDKRTLGRAALVGILVGAAVLNKWLTGLVVFAGWGMSLLLSSDRHSRKNWVHLLFALLCCVVVFLPWQIYIFHAFPVEAKFEYEYNTRHVWEVIEGHRGGNFFYIDQFEAYFGEIGWFFVPFGLVVLQLRYNKDEIANKNAVVVLVTIFATLFVFFSYMVATKINNYFFVAVPVGVVFMAVGIATIASKIGQRTAKPVTKIVFVALSGAAVVSIFNPEFVHKMHDPKDAERIGKTDHAKVYRNLHTKMKKGTAVVLYAPSNEDFQVMFYNNDVAAYVGLIPGTILDSLDKKHVPVAVFEARIDSNGRQFLSGFSNVYYITDKLP